MRTYGIDSKTVRLDASNDAESILLEVGRTDIVRSRPNRDDSPVIRSNYARAMRSGPGPSSSSSYSASFAAGPGTSVAATVGVRRHRIKLSD
jgi:hypothetical protein